MMLYLFSKNGYFIFLYILYVRNSLSLNNRLFHPCKGIEQKKIKKKETFFVYKMTYERYIRKEQGLLFFSVVHFYTSGKKLHISGV